MQTAEHGHSPGVDALQLKAALQRQGEVGGERQPNSHARRVPCLFPLD